MRFLDLYNKMLGENLSSEHELPFPVKPITFKKNTVLTNYGDVEQNLYFIHEGIIEIKIRSNTTEKILDFFFQQEFVTCFTSFLRQTQSDAEMTTLTNCTTEVIRYADLKEAYKTSYHANKIGRLLTEHAYLRKAQREKELLSKTAEERYTEMFESHREYISQIPVNRIARYLGIHPESLSRIRKKLNS